MKTKSFILKQLRNLNSTLISEFKVKSIGIFGSYSRNEQKNDSDVDILVEFRKPVTFFEYLHLEDFLAEKLGVKVDLVTRDALKPALKPTILRDVILV